MTHCNFHIYWPHNLLCSGSIGTDDNNLIPHENALILAGKIPGAWLVQIKDAGYAVMDQYPDEISKILNTFLSTTTPPS
jgi:pimeloyl-ACP methyl ester carboxylesterase